MRRRPGLQGITNSKLTRDVYKAKGEEAKAGNLEALKAQIVTFKANLEEFAHKHKDDIRKDPVFRAQFHTMCANIGVDPLVSNKGVWAQLLGFGDFYYQLGVQIVEACIASRPMNGGLMDVKSLTKAVQRRRGAQPEPISQDDILRAIKKLKVLGNGFDLVTIGRQQYVRSVPGEMNTDKNKVLEMAQADGYVSRELVLANSHWSDYRVDTTLEALLKDGLAMIDDGAPGGARLYWFPCLSTVQQAA